MAEYRVYVIGPDGHFATSRNFVRESDEQAIEWAKQMLEKQPLELWTGERMVKNFTPIRPDAHSANSQELHQGRMVHKAKE
jgi:hypothetical protein